MTSVNRKYKDETWDFRKTDTKEYTHCFHAYPAMMIPQIARKLLTRYGVEGGWLFDPYCGTGTSLVEASIFGMNGLGCDINPLVRLIAAAKATPISLQTLGFPLEGVGRRHLPHWVLQARAGRARSRCSESGLLVFQRRYAMPRVSAASHQSHR